MRAPCGHERGAIAQPVAGRGVKQHLLELRSDGKVRHGWTPAEKAEVLFEMCIQPKGEAAPGRVERFAIVCLCTDKRQARRHAFDNLFLRRLAGTRRLAVIELVEYAQGGGFAVGRLSPALLEHAFVQPFVGEILEDQREHRTGRIIRNRRGLGMVSLDRRQHCRGVLIDRACRRNEQRNSCNSLRIGLEFRFIAA